MLFWWLEWWYSNGMPYHNSNLINSTKYEIELKSFSIQTIFKLICKYLVSFFLFLGFFQFLQFTLEATSCVLSLWFKGLASLCLQCYLAFSPVVFIFASPSLKLSVIGLLQRGRIQPTTAWDCNTHVLRVNRFLLSSWFIQLMPKDLLSFTSYIIVFHFHSQFQLLIVSFYFEAF